MCDPSCKTKRPVMRTVFNMLYSMCARRQCTVPKTQGAQQEGVVPTRGRCALSPTPSPRPPRPDPLTPTPAPLPPRPYPLAPTPLPQPPRLDPPMTVSSKLSRRVFVKNVPAKRPSQTNRLTTHGRAFHRHDDAVTSEENVAESLLSVSQTSEIQEIPHSPSVRRHRNTEVL